MNSKPSAEDLELNSTADFDETLDSGSSTLNGDGRIGDVHRMARWSTVEH